MPTTEPWPEDEEEMQAAVAAGMQNLAAAGAFGIQMEALAIQMDAAAGLPDPSSTDTKKPTDTRTQWRLIPYGAVGPSPIWRGGV